VSRRALPFGIVRGGNTAFLRAIPGGGTRLGRMPEATTPSAPPEVALSFRVPSCALRTPALVTIYDTVWM
jgi:hypothetical protein